MSLQINPWKTLWTKPTATFATLISEAPGYNVLTLSILMGFGSALGQLSGSGLSLPQALGLTLLLGPVMGLGELFLGSWLLAQVGRWLGVKESLSPFAPSWPGPVYPMWSPCSAG